MFRRVLARCTRNGPPVLWPLTILSRKSESMIPLISLWNNRRPSGIRAQRKCSKFVRICFRWRGPKNVFSAGNARRRQSHLIWFISKTTFQSVCDYIILGKKKDKFIFTVESVGQLHAAAIVKKSMSVLRAKLQDLRERIEWNVNICGC